MAHQTFLKRIYLLSTSLLGAAVFAANGSFVSALANGKPVSTTSVASSTVQTIIGKGDTEITRRLASLNTLDTSINATTKLSTGDKSTLANEVNAEISGLNTLKTSLDADTTLAAARTDAQNIISNYRVYALVLPKVRLITTADGQQNVEAKLTSLAVKLQTRLAAEQNAGKNVATLQSELADMTTQTNNADAISTSVEAKVLPLQPTDYDNDHTILSGYRTQLQTAHNDNVAAYNDAKEIVNGVKNL